MLNQEIAAVLKSSEFRDQLAVQGVVPEIMAPDEFSAFIRAEIERWGKVSRDAGISESD
jgi:tripartite-type tricarboxylate transporter receptor subunit TctC